MSRWDFIRECRRKFTEHGDAERLRMLDLHKVGFAFQDTDPDRAVAIYAQGRQLAEALNEPQLAFFYEVWRVIALINYKRDLGAALQPAIQGALTAGKPQYARHPWRFAAVNNLISAYVDIDPVGYAESIRQAQTSLLAEIPPGPGDDRYVTLQHRLEFEMALGEDQKAFGTALEHLAVADSDPNPHLVNWYTPAVFNHLCWLCQRRGDWEAVAGYAARAEEVARRRLPHQRVVGEALIWKAVRERRCGNESRARQLHRGGVRRFTDLQRPPTPQCFDALTWFHELGGDLNEALAVRGEELDSLNGKGRLANECRTRIERCRLLALLNQRTEADLGAARSAARKLLKPEQALNEIERSG